MACKSDWGLKSASNKKTKFAETKLMPNPPARVESRNTCLSVSGAVKSSIMACRSELAVDPSILQCGICLNLK